MGRFAPPARHNGRVTEPAIDYAPLLTDPTPADVQAYRRAARESGAAWAITSATTVVGIVVVSLVGLLFVIPTVGGMLLFVGEALSAGSPVAVVATLFVLLVAGVAVFAVAAGLLSTRGRWSRWLKLDRFARANGFTFTPATAPTPFPGAIFQLGSDRRGIEVLRRTQGRELEMGTYRYVTGSGKNRTTHTWGYLALRLDRRLPHIVLDTRANNGLFGGTNLPASFDRDQILELEGDFGRYFTLYCPRDYERDALYILTPDLMALLIDEAAPFDVEIVDDWMFVYSARPPRADDPETYRRWMRIVATVGSKAVSQTDGYRDDRVAAGFAANVVAPQGTRLKRGIGVGAIILLVLGGAIWVWSFLSDIVGAFL